jgi:group I intron endonuclease
MIIYITTNLINGKQYIGKDEHNRISYLGSGVTLKLAIKKYGKENFRKEIIEYCINREHLKEREEYWLNKYDVSSNNNFYNRINTSAGPVHTIDSKRAISEKLKGCSPYKNKTKEEIDIISDKKHNSMKSGGSQKISDKLRGRLKSEETKQNMKVPKTKENSKKGIPLNKDTKQKISDRLKGRRNLWSTGEKLRKGIIQLDMEGNIINEWISIKEAGINLNIDRAGISNALSGKQHTAGGFMWKLKKE